MNRFVHDRAAAVGICAVCQRAVCRECVGHDAPRLVRRACLERRSVQGFEYRSTASIGGWPLLHVCMGVDPVTMRPRVARGIIAVGNIAVGGLAIGFQYALGGGAFGPTVIDGQGCDPAAADFIRLWLDERMLPPHCR